MTTTDYESKIPNNVDLSSDKRLQRALEHWLPKYLDWWHTMGPTDFEARDVYLRTAVGVDAEGWAQFGHVKMPDYRWGIFLAEPEPDRRVAFGDHQGDPRSEERRVGKECRSRWSPKPILRPFSGSARKMPQR